MPAIRIPKPETFLKHIVCLIFKDTPNGAAKKHSAPNKDSFAISAFVISVYNTWFIVTAGHVLKMIDDRLKLGRSLMKSRIIDYSCLKNKSRSIPFDFENAWKRHIDKDGLDYGIIRIRELYVKQLEAGGVIPLTEEFCNEIPKNINGYYLLGFPEDRIIITKSSPGNVNFNLGCPMIPVQQISKPPNELRQKFDRFYAKVPVATGRVGDKEVKLGNIEGMSGGLIFAIKKINDEEFDYWLIAIQSSWLKKDRILAACYAQPLFDAINRRFIQTRHQT